MSESNNVELKHKSSSAKHHNISVASGALSITCSHKLPQKTNGSAGIFSLDPDLSNKYQDMLNLPLPLIHSRFNRNAF